MAIKFWQDSHRTLYLGDCRSMAEIHDETIQAVITSPPYWGLRKYAGLPDSIWGGEDSCQLAVERNKQSILV